VLRHASAGERANWSGPDDQRPLDERGKRQAVELVETLAQFTIDRILTSPYLRCSETVEPLAGALGLEIEPSDALAEGSQRAALDLLISQLRGSCAVLCSHGDVIGKLIGNGRPCKKGAVWTLEWDGDRTRPTRYIKPRG
jgi:phosphohistidine phosphatase SixA